MTQLDTPLTEYFLSDKVNPTKYKFSHHPSIVGIMKVTFVVPLRLVRELDARNLFIIDSAGNSQGFELQVNLPCEMSNDHARKVWERLVEFGWRSQPTTTKETKL